MKHETERERVKKKIQWFCYQMHITEPKHWTYEEVKKTADKINKKSKTIIVCRDCGKIDVSYPHNNCDTEYEAYRAENMEHYD